ncbi:MAG: MaoC family dehydratase N-terminal domain-containing protein [Mesorhizobium sp.]|nr:MaoC family dehydratase N-terminal domain-containing protein [Mesorhizobium sp.]
MNTLDLANLRRWLGREERMSEPLSASLIERFEATLGNALTRIEDAAPLGIHWCLNQPAIAANGLGIDGHPARGGFLPPVPLPRRMWAGGQLAFVGPLRSGEEITRTSRIEDVAYKQGRSGELVFVTLQHEITSGGRVALTERQDIVYRGLEQDNAATVLQAEARAPDYVVNVDATTTLLFRYSALTFNGHRIHYDLEYSRQNEGYSGLVVHGPLQATLMLHLAARLNGDRPPLAFSYRGVSPLIHGQVFNVNAISAGGKLEMWCANANGNVTMRAEAESYQRF